jgi:hypothetical protein
MFDIKAIVAKQNPESLSLEYQAQYKVLPDTLTVREIVELMTSDEEDMCSLTVLIIDSVIAGKLSIANPHIADACMSPYIKTVNIDILEVAAPIHKNAFKKYIDANNWNLADCLLNNWFNESDNKTNVEQSSTDIIQDETKTNNEKQVTQLNNDFEFSGLLNIPLRADNWFSVIDEMTKTFYSEHRKCPNEAQAWGQLCTSPPIGYTITMGKKSVSNEDCLKMLGVSQLTRSAFKKRWKKYTANKSQ